jgi:polysaccharide export outer membrane protein
MKRYLSHWLLATLLAATVSTTLAQDGAGSAGGTASSGTSAGSGAPTMVPQSGAAPGASFPTINFPSGQVIVPGQPGGPGGIAPRSSGPMPGNVGSSTNAGAATVVVQPTTPGSGAQPNPVPSGQAPSPQQQGSATDKPQAQPPQPNPDAQQAPFADLNERNEFQSFVAQSIGRYLPIFGQELFSGVPSTFAPVDRIPVVPDYQVGPGDELVIRIWGQLDADMRLLIDRDGTINIPRVGVVNVAGVRFQELQPHLKREIGKVFRNFEINVTLGQLRTLQIFVVGYAKKPGSYTVSSLSTLVNTIFAAGGPSARGSMRNIQLKRADKVVTEFDFYDLLRRGDKSKDVSLQSGDVIYIPPIGDLVALAGSVNTPAIYELKKGASLSELLDLAGGLTITAQGQKVTLERIVDRKIRQVDEFSLDQTGLSRKVAGGDVINVFSISPRFDNAIVLRGNVAAPARYPWRKGMRVMDLFVDKNALIPTSYWQRQNAGAGISRHSRREVNWDYATLQRLDGDNLSTKIVAFDLGKAIRGDATENMELRAGDIVSIFGVDDTLPRAENEITLSGSILGGQKWKFVWREGRRIRDIIPSAQWLADYYDYWFNMSGTGLRSEINWDHANLIRLLPQDLTKTLLSFDLGKAVLEGEATNNIALNPGDEISIYSKTEYPVPVAKQTVYVRIEGEVNRPGMYRVLPGETLRQFLARTGGLSPNAYLYGSEFTRESTRVLQQKGLNEVVDRLEADVQRNFATSAQATISKDDSEALKNYMQGQMGLVGKLRQTKATGRIVLDLQPSRLALSDLPDLVLEDGDRFYVPPKPSTVNVLGAVYNQNSFVYGSDKRVTEYLQQAGGAIPTGDTNNIYVVKANGEVVVLRGGLMRITGDPQVMPGDAVVVPEKLKYISWTRELRDWSQIFYQFALGVAGLKVLKDL